MPAATTLSTVFIAQACPVRWTKQACAINTVSLCSLETATFLAKVFRILIQVLSDLAASSTKSCTKFCRHIQHPSLSEEKAKPVEPERLKLKIERYRSLEWNVLFFLSDVFIFFANILVFSEKNKGFRNDTGLWPETDFYTYVCTCKKISCHLLAIMTDPETKFPFP